MKKLEKLSMNELDEMLQCLSTCVHEIERNYLHVADHLQPELKAIRLKLDAVMSEIERRED